MLNEKILFSLILILAHFFFKKAGPIIIEHLKDFHRKHNPDLLVKASWYFDTVAFLNKAISIASLILIPLIWLGLIPIDIS